MPAHDKTVPPKTDESEYGGKWPEQREWRLKHADASLIEGRTREHFAKLIDITKDMEHSFLEIERMLIPLVFGLGRLVLALFLCRRHERLDSVPLQLDAGRRFERRTVQGRWLGTFFGKVRYWRTYMYAPTRGYYPLDVELSLPADGFSTNIVGLVARIATKMSYAATNGVLRCFLGWSPSTTTIEHAVLGLGRQTAAWFEQAPIPDDDGEVLIIQIDGKCPPTATEAELEKRRGKRRPAQVPGSPRHRGRSSRRKDLGKPPRRGKRAQDADSPRHRGRAARKRRGPKKRRKKGDKSKNGRMVTVLVMYTLKKGVDKDGNPVLLGPINRRVYASFARKRHAFAIARREANRRGFHDSSGKVIQIVSDGDEDLALYRKEFFPKARHTLDIYHALEYLWKAGRSLHREGSEALEDWVAEQRRRLYRGHVKAVVRDLKTAFHQIPRTGPGNKGKRERLEVAFTYLGKRVGMMDYKELLGLDLEISSGAVEGAVRYIVGQRFDNAGMRWIKARAEALLQLRCIEINEQWDDFIDFVHHTQLGQAKAPLHGRRLLASEPQPLPALEAAA